VFKRFYRGASGENIPGTGLGLSIVNRIVEIHRASIQLGHSKYNGLQVDILLTPAIMKMAENTGETLTATG
jgi:two-component system sensor histidine kinase TctE